MSWRDSLPEEMQGLANIQDVESVESLVQQFGEAQSFIGSSIRIPSEHASPEDMAKFNEKLMLKVPTLINKPALDDDAAMGDLYTYLGRPSEVAGYGEGVDPKMQNIAHSLGLSKVQAEKLTSHFKEHATLDNQTSETLRKDGMKALASEWGFAMDQRMATAVATLKKTGAPAALIDAAETGKINAETARWAYTVGASLGKEVGNFNPADNETNRTLTPREAKAQLYEMRNDRKSPLWDKSHPLNKEMIAKQVELVELSTGKA